ncbi:hypothetical protein ScPMuIL_000575 [Solemya velum]
MDTSDEEDLALLLLAEAEKVGSVMCAGRSEIEIRANGAAAKISLVDTGLQWTTLNKSELSGSIQNGDILGFENNSSMGGCLLVHYIKRLEKNIWRRTTLKISGDVTKCDRIAQHLQTAMSGVEGRPGKLLVLINPISGNKNGRSIFRKEVLPLFKLSGVHVNVKVLQKPKHIPEILSTYDFNNIDGIAVLGGDGTYSECMNYLMKLKQESEGNNYNDPNVTLHSTTMPIAVIPTGTGNVMALSCYGNKDVQTAVLHTIQGATKKFNIFSVYNNDRLLGFSGTCAMYGIFTDTIYRMNSYRQFTGLRLCLSMLKSLILNRNRLTRMELEYTSIDGSTESAQEINDARHQDKKTGAFTNILAMVSDFNDVTVPEKLELTGDGDIVKLCLYRNFTRSQYITLAYRWQTLAGNCMIHDIIERLPVTGFQSETMWAR